MNPRLLSRLGLWFSVKRENGPARAMRGNTRISCSLSPFNRIHSLIQIIERTDYFLLLPGWWKEKVQTKVHQKMGRKSLSFSRQKSPFALFPLKPMRKSERTFWKFRIMPKKSSELMLSPREYRLYTANQKLITLFLGYSKIIFSRWFVRIVSEFSFEFGEPESNVNQFQPREKGRGKPSKIMKFWALLQADRNGGAIQIQIWPRTCQYTLQELLGNIPLGWNGFVDFFSTFQK